MRPANWKPVKNCELYYGMLFADGRDFIVVSTDIAFNIFWSEFPDSDNDDDIVSLVITKLPKTFEAFTTQYAGLDWDSVRSEVNSDRVAYAFENQLREARFAKGATAACLFAHLLEDAQTAGSHAFDICDMGLSSVRSATVGEMKRIFDPSYKGST